MDSITLLIIIIILCLVFSAFFSASETAITGVSDAAIHKLTSDGNKKAKIVEALKKNRENLITTILIANNALNICASSFAAGISFMLFGEEGILIATFVMTLAIILFSEVLPKTYAIQNTEKVALEVGLFLKYVVVFLMPLTWLIKFCIKGLNILFGIKENMGDSVLTAIDELRGTIDLHHSAGRVVREDKEMLGSILDLPVIEVKTIMVHRKDIVSINADLPIEQIVDFVHLSGHTRIPLWKNNPENIIGILHIKNLLKMMKEVKNDLSKIDIMKIAIKPFFVPESADLKTQLAEFSLKKSHIAIVIDEYGALEGLITLTDIIEEIIGRIDDEHNEIDDIKVISNNMCEVKGSVTIRDLNRIMDWNISDSEASRVAGLLMHEIERIPKLGEEFVIQSVKFTVLEKNINQISKIKLENIVEEKK